MMICKKIISTITAAAAAVALFTVSVPVALAGSDNASRKAITSSRSFPKMNTARKDLLKETVSVSSDDSESWGGVESLNVPETKSTAEKKAEEEAKKAEEERKAAEKAAAEAARLQAAEVSRSRAAPRQERVHRARIRFLRVLPNHLSRLLRVEESSNDISHCTAPPLGRCRAFSTGDAATMPCPLPLRCRAL